MASGIWIAAGAAAAQADNMGVIANNLANASTQGYKKDQPTFKEYVARAEKIQTPKEIAPGPVTDKDFTPLDDKEQSGVVLDTVSIRLDQGSFQQTQNSLDIALDGKGFLEVLTPEGIRWTKAGNLKRNEEGVLVTAAGYPVLSAQEGNETAPANRFISLSDSPYPVIDATGEIFEDNKSIATLSIVSFKDPSQLKKTAGLLFENKNPQNKNASSDTEIRQGFLEMSNVNPITELTQMLWANRLFEQDLKVMKTYDELMNKEANEIGKV